MSALNEFRKLAGLDSARPSLDEAKKSKSKFRGFYTQIPGGGHIELTARADGSHSIEVNLGNDTRGFFQCFSDEGAIASYNKIAKVFGTESYEELQRIFAAQKGKR